MSSVTYEPPPEEDHDENEDDTSREDVSVQIQELVNEDLECEDEITVPMETPCTQASKKGC